MEYILSIYCLAYFSSKYVIGYRKEMLAHHSERRLCAPFQTFKGHQMHPESGHVEKERYTPTLGWEGDWRVLEQPAGKQTLCNCQIRAGCAHPLAKSHF